MAAGSSAPRVALVRRMLRNALSAFTRAFDALWRCTADPESIVPLALLWVPALRSSAKRAAPRPGHERGSRGRVVICPTGSLLTPVSSPLCKNILLRHLVETDLLIPPSRPTRGAYRDRHGRRARDAVDAAAFCARKGCRADSLNP
jgi:hypothetical protein